MTFTKRGHWDSEGPVRATQLSRSRDLSSTFGPGLRPLAVSTHASRSQGHGVTTHRGMDPPKQIRGGRGGAGQRAPSRRTRRPRSRALCKRAGPVISRRAQRSKKALVVPRRGQSCHQDRQAASCTEATSCLGERQKGHQRGGPSSPGSSVPLLSPD